MTTDELRERIAETIFAPIRRDLIDVIGFDPGPLSALSEEEKARYLAIADAILALFGEPVAWRCENISGQVVFKEERPDPAWFGPEAWRVVPLYALTETRETERDNG